MYKLYKSFDGIEAVIRTIDNAYIPMDEQNTDYQAYLKWLDEGNIPQEAE